MANGSKSSVQKVDFDKKIGYCTPEHMADLIWQLFSPAEAVSIHGPHQRQRSAQDKGQPSDFASQHLPSPYCIAPLLNTKRRLDESSTSLEIPGKGWRLKNEQGEGGMMALGNDIPAINHDLLHSLPDSVWNTQRDRYVCETWVDHAEAAIRSGAGEAQ